MGLTTRELIDYLKLFPGDAYIRVLVASPKTRQFFNADGIFAITDAGCPVMCIEVGEPEPMDGEMIKICEEEEKAMRQEDVECQN